MKNKKIISYLIVLILCTSLFAPAYAVVSQSESFYVADYANVLSNTTEEMIINYNGALEQQCQGAQIVVVTVDYLDGMYSDEYAYKLFNEWGVGSADYNNGMLLLLAVQERKCWLAYGLGLNSQLSSDDVDNMLEDYFYDNFDAGNYDEAVTELFMELLGWYDERYDSSTAAAGAPGKHTGDNYYYNNSVQQYYYNPGYSFVSIIAKLISILVVISLLAFIFGFGNGRRYGYRSGGSSWLPWMLYFNSRNHNRNHRPHNDRNDWPPRGGGFGGGSGGFGGGFGGGSGRGGGGFSGGGGGRR